MVNAETEFRDEFHEPALVPVVAGPGLDLGLAPAPASADSEPEVEPEPDDAGTVLLAYLREQVRALTALDPRVREGAPDSVHQMRVATRRLRSVLSTSRGLLEPGATDPLREELRWLAAALGTARDNEVMHDRLRAGLAREPRHLVAGPVGERLDEYFAVVLRDAQRAVQQTLDGHRYSRVLADLEAFVAAPPWAPLAEEPARTVLPGLVRGEWKRLRRAVRSARSTGAGKAHDLALHEVRKRAKRLRYASESIASLQPKRSARIVESARQVQDILGDQHDGVVARDILLRLGMQAFVRGENAFTYGRLHAAEQAGSDRLELEFQRVWRKFPQPRRPRHADAG